MSAGRYLDARGIDRETQEFYLGPRDTWEFESVHCLDDRFRARGWDVNGTDSIIDTLSDMRARSVRAIGAPLNRSVVVPPTRPLASPRVMEDRPMDRSTVQLVRVGIIFGILFILVSGAYQGWLLARDTLIAMSQCQQANLLATQELQRLRAAQSPPAVPGR